MTERPAAETPSTRRVILVVGDSLTAGFGLENGKEEAYPALLQRRLDAAGLDFEVVNGGESGRTTSGGVTALDWYLKRRVDIAILALGGNDALRGVSVAVVERNLVAMIEKLRAKEPNCRVVIAGMQAQPSMGKDYCDAFAAVFPKVAKEHGADLVPFLLEGVAADPALNQADHIHPTAGGQKILADNVWRVLEGVARARTP